MRKVGILPVITQNLNFQKNNRILQDRSDYPWNEFPIEYPIPPPTPSKPSSKVLDFIFSDSSIALYDRKAA